MSTEKKIDTTTEILRGLFCVILVSTILTIYEIFMFYTNVVPTVRGAVDGGIDDIANQLNDRLDVDNLCPVRKQFISVYKTLQDQENTYVDTINTYTIVSGISLLVVLFGTLAAIRYIVTQRDPAGLKGYTWSVGLTTVGLIMIFQYIFYNYGQRYKYLSGVGKEELIYYLSTRL